MHHHWYRECEGCQAPRRHVGWFLGHWLCKKCKHRKNMPLVGYKDKRAWDFEKKLINKAKKRLMPYLTYSEIKYLKSKYMQW